jgi:hypothetical protein
VQVSNADRNVCIIKYCHPADETSEREPCSEPCMSPEEKPLEAEPEPSQESQEVSRTF